MKLRFFYAMDSTSPKNIPFEVLSRLFCYGFVLEIENLTETEQVITLFQDAALPARLSISTMGHDHDYSALLRMARTEGLVDAVFCHLFRRFVPLSMIHRSFSYGPGYWWTGWM